MAQIQLLKICRIYKHSFPKISRNANKYKLLRMKFAKNVGNYEREAIFKTFSLDYIKSRKNR